MVTKAVLMRMMRQHPNLIYFSDPVYHHKGRARPRSIKTPDGIFPSLKWAAEHYGVTDQTIDAWVSGAGRYAGQFFYVDAEVGSVPIINNKPVMTPKGRFNSLKEAAKAFNVHYSVISKKAKFGKNGYYFLTT